MGVAFCGCAPHKQRGLIAAIISWTGQSSWRRYLLQLSSNYIFHLRRKVSFRDLSNHLGFQSGLFFTTMRLRTQFSATLA